MARAIQDIEENLSNYISLKSISALDDNLNKNCIQLAFKNAQASDYSDFLMARRQLMAQKIKSFYFSL